MNTSLPIVKTHRFYQPLKRKLLKMVQTRTLLAVLTFSFAALTNNAFAQCGGYALEFKAANKSFVNPNSSTRAIRDSFTIEFWVKPNATIKSSMSESNGFFNYTGTSGQNYAVFPIYGGAYPDTAGVGISVGTNGVAVFEHASSYLPPLLVYYTTLSSSSWTHIAVVYSKKTPHLYINGSFVKKGLTSNINKLIPSSQLGDKGSYGPFSGVIDEFRLWKQPLSATEIANWYNKLTFLSHPKISDLFSYWKFDEGSGTVVSDSSGHGNTGTRMSSNVTPVLPKFITPGFFVIADTIPPVITCPGNITQFIDLGVCGSVVTYSVQATDNCPGETIEQIKGLASGSTFPVGMTMNTFVVTDAQGNTDTCSFMVTVNDTIYPTVTCPGNMTLSNDNGKCGANVTYTVTTWDNCPGETLKQIAGLPSGSMFPVGTTVNTFVVTDIANFTDTCSFSITVNDNEDPVVTCPGNMTVNNDAGKCSAKVNYSVTQTDNCPGSVLTQIQGLASGSDFPVGVTTNTFVATDGNGNTDTCSFDVTVKDVELPSIACVSNQIRNTDSGTCSYTTVGTEFDLTSYSDNCPGVTITNDYNNSVSLAGAVFNKGVTTVKWTATDVNGNKATCSYNVTVKDQEFPTITCIGNVTRSMDSTTCSYTVSGTELDPTSYSDNCPGAVISNYLTNTPSLAGTILQKGSTTITWEVTDASGNKTSCGFVVTVVDDQAPSIACVGDQTRSTDAGKCSYKAVGNEFNPTSYSDNCPGSTITNSFNNSSSLTGAVFPKGVTSVTWTITDASNNSATCSFDVTVEDNEDPKITCQSDQTKSMDAGRCDYTVSGTEFDPASYSDNCPKVSIENDYNNSNTLAGAIFTKGTVTVTWTATDSSGNTATCSFDVTVKDDEDPTISCVSNQTRSMDPGKCDYTVVGTEFNPTSYGDNCPNPTIKNNYNNSNTLAGAVFTKGTSTVTWTVTDASGNTSTCSFDVTVNDDEDPTISCVGNQSKNMDPGKCTYTVNGTEFDPTSFDDNCPNATIKNNFNNTASLAGAVFDKGLTTVTWTVTDASNNTATCSFNVTVIDNQNPTITCQSDQTRSTDNGKCTYAVSGTEFDPVSFTDNCPGSTTSNNFNNSATLNNAIFPKGTTTVIWTVTDAANNIATCSFDVTINDNEDPKISCVTDQTRSTDAGKCSYKTVGTEFDPVSYSDNCPGVTITNDYNNSNTLNNEIFPKGTTTVTWTATDASNNTSTCSIDIEVEDDEDPTITCISDKTKSTNPGVCTYKVTGTEFDPVSTDDNCGVASVTNDHNGTSSLAGALFSKGTTTVTWTVMDSAGNTSTCSFDVTVNDNENPKITCFPSTTFNTDPGECTFKIKNFSPFSNYSDNCGIDPSTFVIDYTGTQTLKDAVFSKGTTVVTFSVKDSSGNVGTCSFNVTVVDNEDPTINCVADQTRSTDNGKCTYTAVGTEFDPTSDDNCGVASLTNDYTGTSSLAGAVFSKGTTTVEWTVMDSAGNSATCSYDVTVNDNEDPTITCVADQTKSTDAGQCTYTAVGTEFDPTSTDDNCGVASVTNDYTGTSSLAGAVFSNGTTTVEWTVMDSAGNSATCSYDVTVNDNEDPTITCVADQTKSTDAGQCTYTTVGTEFDPTSTDDNCGVASVTNDYTGTSSLAGAVFSKGTTTVEWTVMDSAGNSATCSYDVTVNDNEDPTITCVADQTKSTDAGQCTYTTVGTEFDPTSTDDNCGVASVTNDYTGTSSLAGAVFSKGTTTVEWTVMDSAGNSATCSYDVTVNDNEDPTISCKVDLTRSTDAGQCTYTTVGTEFDPTSTDDNCGVASVTNDYTGTSSLAGAVFSKGTTYVEWTVMDSAGNSAVCTTDVTVLDNEDPTISCKVDLTRSTDAGQCTYTTVGTEFDPTSTDDNCGVASVTNDYTGTSSLAGAVFSKGTTYVEWTVMDSAGNSAVCTTDVTVLDNEDPSITCVADQTKSTDAGQCTYTTVGTEFDPTSTDDNCGVASVTNDYTGTSSLAGAVFSKGTTTVEWTVMDSAGNSATCSYDVTVNDNEDPVVYCVAHDTVTYDSGFCSYTVPDTRFDLTNVSDNCGIASIINDKTNSSTLAGLVLTSGNHEFNWTVKDSAGNMAVCKNILYVLIPEIDIRGNNISIPDGDTTPSLADYTDFGDTFPNIPIVKSFVIRNIQRYELKIYKIRVTGPDSSYFVVSNINTPTTVSPLGRDTFDVTFSASTIGVRDATIIVYNSDCDEPRYTFDITGEVICTYPDFTVCPGNMTRFTSSNTCDTSVAYNVSFTGIPTPTLTYEFSGATTGSGSGSGSGSTFNKGVTNVLVMATNACGTDSCQFTITVIDNVKPVVTCPGNQNRSTNNGQCTYTVVGTEFNPVYTDNCPGASSINNYNNTSSLAGTVLPKGTTTVMWTFTDASSNVTTCTFDIIVSDTESPKIVCRNDTSSTNVPGTCGRVITYTTPVASDNCPGVTVSQVSGLPSGSTFPGGVTINKFIATDAAGNKDSCSFKVTIIDTEVPNIICKNRTVFANTTGNKYTPYKDELDPIVKDNCTLLSFKNSLNDSNTLKGYAIPSGTTTVKWIARDISGNVDSCSLNITVVACGAGIPSGANVYTGNVTLNTQADVDAFFKTTGPNAGNKYTKVDGNLTIFGNNNSDPVKNLCNLDQITEVTGRLLINAIRHNAAPTQLTHLSAIKTVGGTLQIANSNKLVSVIFPNLESVGDRLIVRGCINATDILFPKLESIGREINIGVNFKVERLRLSDQASSFTWTGSNSKIYLGGNGDSATNNTVIDMNKIKVVETSLTFEKNNNAGISNFDNIFSSLDSIHGDLIIKDNVNLAKCCIAATTVVGGFRDISGNTGNCKDTIAIKADCGTLHKRSIMVFGDGDSKTNPIHGFNVFPSPNKGNFTIEFTRAAMGDLKLTITDLVGRVVYTDKQHHDNYGYMEIPVNMEFAAEGQYVVKVEMNGKVYISRVMLVK
ncbi:MAG: HYR domain-containing protein [Flavobacteriales bacterium]|nr:HYR domain-containing protein [Flavobacteriales bacterium]